MNVINYEYSDAGQPVWAHQIEISAYSGWGAALNATVEGAATSNGSCTTNNSNFPAQGVSPLQSWRIGEAFFTTTATTPGAIGTCTTTWQLTFQNGAYTPAQAAYNANDVRCDNATAGNPYVGCVVPWYAAPVSYSQAANPTLAGHVSRAQASGLPGATFEAPLYRTTNDAINNANRTQACGDAPSIAGLSCDEYPLASSYQGLSAGGTRRTFDGCNFSLPSQTGPTGVSVCMIAEGDNNSQGGIMSQFYRWQRVLDGDPFRVLVLTARLKAARSAIRSRCGQPLCGSASSRPPDC
ncbi:NucA/NucB deoxyribonuclease domain-containing protein [Kitasatospora sp. NPDC001660]